MSTDESVIINDRPFAHNLRTIGEQLNRLQAAIDELTQKLDIDPDPAKIGATARVAVLIDGVRVREALERSEARTPRSMREALGLQFAELVGLVDEINASTATPTDPVQPEPTIPVSVALPLIGYIHDCLRQRAEYHDDKGYRILDPLFLAAFDHMVEGTEYRTSGQMFDGLKRSDFATIRRAAKKKD